MPAGCPSSGTREERVLQPGEGVSQPKPGGTEDWEREKGCGEQCCKGLGANRVRRDFPQTQAPC